MKVTSVVGNLVDVIGGRVFPARVTMEDGLIVDVERRREAYDRYILPGLIDSHVHVESSLLVPSRFAEAAVPHGVTAVVADPHEIANVMGMDGIRYMMSDGRTVPMRFYFTAPSCVPVTPFETSGASLGWEEVKELMDMEDVVALGEMVDFPGVIGDDPDCMAKIEIARSAGKPVDGHAPGLSGSDLDSYIFAGITTDHECTSRDEAEEKARKGMTIQVREGSACKNMRELIPFAKHNRFFLVTDDIHAADLQEGYIDRLLRMAVAYGIDPMTAVRAATIWPAEHYHLQGGSVSPRGVADLVVVKDLVEFRVLEVYIDGQLVAKDGEPLFEAHPMQAPLHILRREWRAQDFDLPYENEKARVRVIEVLPDQIVSLEYDTEVPVLDGMVQSDVSNDILRVAVLNRYREAPPALGFIKGFGLRKGAIASTVGHDSHNIIVIGVDGESMAKAANGVSTKGGYLATDGVREVILPLPIAGLMSPEPVKEVVKVEREVLELTRELGCRLPSPFMTMSFQCLLMVPGLRICDKGLFDSRSMRFVETIIR